MKKILAVKLRALGDTVLMTAALSELRRLWPHTKLDVLVPQPWGALLEHHPAIDRLWLWTSKLGFQSLKATVPLAWALKQQGYETVIHFHARDWSAFFLYCLGIPQRAMHFHGHHHPNRFSTVEIPGKGQAKSIIERDLDVLRALGGEAQFQNPSVLMTQEEILQAKNFLSLSPCPRLGLGLGASRPTKCWPIERYVELAVQWVLSTQGSVLAFLGPDEVSLERQFLLVLQSELKAFSNTQRDFLGSRIQVTHSLSLRALAAVIQQLTLWVGNDSGPKHVAVAVGTPTITFFGPEHPSEWHPYSAKEHPYFFVDALSCRTEGFPGVPPWCSLKECQLEQHRCLRSISMQDVLEFCLKELTHISSRDNARLS